MQEKQQEGSVPFYAVDFLEIEKMKGIDVSLSKVVEELELIRLENKEEALSKTHLCSIDISDNYLLIIQDGVLPVQLFTRSGSFINNVGGVGQGPGEYIRNI